MLFIRNLNDLKVHTHTYTHTHIHTHTHTHTHTHIYIYIYIYNYTNIYTISTIIHTRVFVKFLNKASDFNTEYCMVYHYKIIYLIYYITNIY